MTRATSCLGIAARLLPILTAIVNLFLPSESSAFIRHDLTPDATFLAAETCRNVPVKFRDPMGTEFILMPHTWGVRSAGESWYDSLYPGRADIAGWWAGSQEAGRVAVSGTKKAAVGLYDVGRAGVDVTRMAGWSVGGGDAAQFEFYSGILQSAAAQDPDQLFKNMAVGTLKGAPTFGLWNLAEAEAGTFGAASVSGNYDDAAALNIQLLALASAPKVGNAIRRNVAGATRALADRMILRTTLADCRVPRVGPTVEAAAAKSIPTPQGPAIQSMTAEAKAALRQAQSGASVYRAGGLGTQRAAEGQYWSFQNPASTPGYANRMGMPSTGSGEPFIMGGRVNPSSPFITREAPGIENNLGGSVEAVTQPGGVTIDWFHMP